MTHDNGEDRRAAIIGTGLIGASIGMELRRLGWEVAGWDIDPDALSVAHQRGAIDVAAGGLDDAVCDAEVVFLAGPLSATLNSVRGVRTDALVTDVAGVKQAVIDAVPTELRFVGGHPMAGREHAGPQAATPSLFRGASWVLTPDRADPRDVDFLSGIVASFGAIPRIMAARDHDRSVAQISHLPHVLAAALVAGVAQEDAARTLAAGGFRDLTRVAASDVGWWPEVLSANAMHLGDAVDRLIEELERMRASAIAGDLDDIAARLDVSRRRRRDLAPMMVRVRVMLQDKPGEIAAVGRSLERSSVDVRDLQLRHAPHGGGGVLTLTVRPGDEEPLRSSLEAEGFEIEIDT
jgi:prephenate dehydrogenase